MDVWRAVAAGRGFTRTVQVIDGEQCAVVTYLSPRGLRRAMFFLPPDSEATGPLWRRLEDIAGGRVSFL